MIVKKKTEKGVICFIKVPDKANIWDISDYNDYLLLFWESCNNDFIADIELDSPDYEIIGLTSEFTEEQAKIIVHAHIEDDGNIYGYFDYPQSDTIKEMALDSFKSLMKYLQVYEVNPFGDGPKYTDYKTREEWAERYSQWKEYESKTGRWLVLFKPNEK